MNPALIAIPAGLGLALLVNLTTSGHSKQDSAVPTPKALPLGDSAVADSTKSLVPRVADTSTNHAPLVRATGAIDLPQRRNAPTTPETASFQKHLGLRIQKDRWLGIELGITGPFRTSHPFIGLSGTLDQTRSDRSYDTSGPASSAVNHLRRSVGLSTTENGLRANIGYEHWLPTPSPLLLTLRTSFEATWMSAESTRTIQTDAYELNSANWIITKGTPKSETWEQSSQEYGPKLGVGLRYPAFGRALHFVGGLESGISWKAMRSELDSSRTTGWKTTPLQWGLGFDWVF